MKYTTPSDSHYFSEADGLTEDGEFIVWDTRTIRAGDAIALLDDNLGSGQDPIRFRKKDTTAIDVGYELEVYPPNAGQLLASEVKIAYHGSKGPRLLYGSLRTMLEDRIKAREEVLKPPTIRARRFKARERLRALEHRVNKATHKQLDEIMKGLIKL